jgi:hypothetical protein
MSEHVNSNEVEVSVNKTLSKIRKNPWIAASVVLAIALIVVIVISSMNSGGGVGPAAAGKNLVSFVNAQGNGEATYVSGVKEGSLYNIVVNYNGEDIPVFVTLDGKYLISSPIPLSDSAAPTQDEPAPTEVPKSDKPVADFYVFSYCPFGTQMEKAVVPAYNLLKNKADINIVFIGAMHDPKGCSGAACFEKTESLRQICIQKNYGKDKLFAYLDKFLVNADIGNCQGTDACVSPLIEAIYTQIGIDKTKINTCIAKDAEALYVADEAKAQSLGIGGSPTVTINGVKASVGRSPALVQQAICSAFNSAPAECNQTLSSAAASAGFGSTASSSSTASCG